MARLRQQAQEILDQAAQLPPGTTYRWDPQPEGPPVVQTHRRQLTGLRWGTIHAQVVVRRATPKTAAASAPSALLPWVPKGGRYAFDLIVEVGVQTFLATQTLAELQTALRQRTPSLELPVSSLYELGHRFLFYFGALHTQAAPRLRDYLRQRGPCQWLIDGTLEPGTVEFFGVLESPEHLCLSCRKIPTENATDVAALLRATAQQFGAPSQVCRDLSHILKIACEQALPGVAQRICHSHLARDVGMDLYQIPQADLSRRLKSLKLLTHWSSQRHSQAEALRQQLQNQGTYSLLNQWLQGQPVPSERWPRTWGRELLLALHAWLQDFAQDGQHLGFPFDPHLLYFHRRLVRVDTALTRLWHQPGFARQAPVALANFYQSLQAYRTDPEILAAATHFEKAYAIFESLRQALRLTTTEPNPLHAAYALSEREQQEMLSTLAQFRVQAQARSQKNPDQLERGLYLVLSQHLETHGPYLQGIGERTTNAAEAHWNRAKRQRRQTHGRKKLTRDFGALPAEYMLVPNLEIPRYVELVLGTRDNLPDKLAEAARTAGSYAEWRQSQRPQRWGRLPQRVLRQPTFLDRIIGVAEQVGKKLFGGDRASFPDLNLQGN